ncbi:MAG: hypothetical protein A2268_11265 [Candidatus Raymondbacteria bacterium RifOxyA12_full_50_37]|uniref:Transposase n=1 Tax=Candidatus Raymondbacteria bacterium RIFOXYD12_FULL_49_13 TaxID=1817890 RepID=A0A1F7FAL4_UNCRA|nr:MAG: hypothetical protein A2268_11265 [Candidatus Raymondbacteria bacterium RifOxyA12_full_50_37]OGJ89637.1 MAG: hypothetical protein A2350_20330 [Candidatus Raymondbacteria bacterium RifOxyB12_full_50_8]OGJ92353.1 MAG: hypothetical protein A2248_10390 [Candidatus Raymondbacteria bacterium RIFOXYA2_FULL_49_16]OGJ94979.1 MAG: hypothetical protein A2487_05270 [Candidatus Raymondbacteria bacterium RifOxyC12_full_50_8]OGJ99334.1 MAG: hypothetical protein A2453_13450 [Candidatus Raymondbacteria b
MEFQIRDRLSFVRFLGLSLKERIPDAKTIWHYHELLANAGVMQRLFNKFNRYLEQQGFKAKKGQLIDATIIEVPRQKMTEEERKEVNDGKTPEAWEKKPAQMSQKDRDARWTKKHNKSYFGYKNHINADGKNKLIREYKVTSAQVHDSQVMDELLTKNKNSKDVYADSAYRSDAQETTLKNDGFRSHINTKGYRNKALSKFQVKMNKIRSKIRSRVEHVFGDMKSMKADFIRCIGIIRAEVKIGMINLTYNFRRYAYLATNS